MRRTDLAAPVVLLVVALAGVVQASGGVYRGLPGGDAAGAPLVTNGSTAAWDTTVLMSGGLLRFGGIDANFPAFKRNGAQLLLRLADDSGNTSLTAASLALAGTLAGARTVTSDKTNGVGAPFAIAAADSCAAFTNAGAAAKVYLTLPATAAGLRYTGIVQGAVGLRLTAPAGSTIRLKTQVSAAGGFVESVEVGSTITLLAISATEWYAVEALGTWTTG